MLQAGADSRRVTPSSFVQRALMIGGGSGCPATLGVAHDNESFTHVSQSKLLRVNKGAPLLRLSKSFSLALYTDPNYPLKREEVMRQVLAK